MRLAYWFGLGFETWEGWDFWEREVAIEELKRFMKDRDANSRELDKGR